MKVITSGLAGVVVMVSLLCACSAQAAISTMYQWNMGDNDGVVVGDPAPATTTASVGGATANLTMDTVSGGSGIVVNSTSAALGMNLDGGAHSKYYNGTVQVTPADNHLWGFDVVLKAADAGRFQYAMSIGGYNSSAIILQASGGENNHWSLHRPGAAFRETATLIDTQEHHLVYAAGALYMDGTKITTNDVNLDYLTADFTPAASVTVGNGDWNFYNSGFQGAISYARVFQWTGEFNINDVTIPAIPEPGTVSLLAAGLFGLLGSARRKRA